MLGLGRNKVEWHWAACGKHPQGKDYFRFDVTSPLQSAFAAWMDQGFSSLPDHSDVRRAICFWRFWAKGVKKGQLVCGMLKASSDGIGRPYPLLIVGVGSCNAWEKNWEHLPRMFEATWQQAEYIASKRFARLQELADALRRIRPPEQNCPEGIGKQEFGSGYPMSDGSLVDAIGTPEDVEHHVNRLKSQQELWIAIGDQPFEKPSLVPVLWGVQCKRHGLDVPQAFFLGGSPGKAFVAVFARPLRQKDFIRLWSVGGNEVLYDPAI